MRERERESEKEREREPAKLEAKFRQTFVHFCGFLMESSPMEKGDVK